MEAAMKAIDRGKYIFWKCDHSNRLILTTNVFILTWIAEFTTDSSPLSAYEDSPQTIGYDATVSAPLMVSVSVSVGVSVVIITINTHIIIIITTLHL